MFPRPLTGAAGCALAEVTIILSIQVDTSYEKGDIATYNATVRGELHAQAA
jgi:hypothetical protein